MTQTCANCGGPLTTENYAEATITFGKCGYSWASHFGGGEIQEKPCRAARAFDRSVVDALPKPESVGGGS